MRCLCQPSRALEESARLPRSSAVMILVGEMDDTNLVRHLKELSELHTSGEISTEEFSLAKARLLGQPHPTFPIADISPTADPPLDSVVPSDRPGIGFSAAQPIHAPPRPVKNVPQLGGENTGGIVTTGGGVLTFLAFFAMPMAEIPLISASATGADLASLGSEAGSLAMLWLVPVLAITVLTIGLWQRFSATATSESRKVGSHAVMALAGLIFFIYIALLVSVQSKLSDARGSTVGVNAISFTGVGFWLALIGTLVAAAGAFMVLNSARPAGGAFSTKDGMTYSSLAALEADYKAHRILGPDYRRIKRAMISGQNNATPHPAENTSPSHSAADADSPSRAGVEDPQAALAALNAEYKSRRLTGPDFRRERRRLQALIDGTPDS